MSARKALLPAILFLFLTAPSLRTAQPHADVVFRNGAVYTMESSQPWAKAVAVTGNAIVAVLDSNEEAQRFVGPKTRVIDLAGRLLVPGFIDGHTHFSAAGELVNDANLMKVADDHGLRKEIARVVGIVVPGEWITGGLWGAYEQWALGAEKAGAPGQRWPPIAGRSTS
jgi:predicted amidohydrolase YtcJ